MSQQTSDISFHHLSIPERILLVERIWDSIAAEHEKVELSPELCAELDQRMAEHDANPEDVVSWDDVKASLGIKS